MQNTTQALHDSGQQLWLDHITRGMLDDGTLRRYIEEHSVSGLTSNPTIFDEAIGKTSAYDGAIQKLAKTERSPEALFTELALEDLRRAADLFRPAFDASSGREGWVSMEVSPLLAEDAAASTAAAERIHRDASRPNLFVKIPGTQAGLKAIEDTIFAGIPVNVTLLFSREQYLAAADAYMRGIERRIAAGSSPQVASVASLFVSRWDKAANERVPGELRNRLGVAVGAQVYAAYRELSSSERWRKLEAQGARLQTLLWASTGTKDPGASDTLYVEALASPDTIDTMPEKTLLAFADHGKFTPGGELDLEEAERVLTRFAQQGIEVPAMAEELQRAGAQAFVQSWQHLMARISQKSGASAGAPTRSRRATP